MLKRAFRSAAVQAVTARFVGLYLSFALRTTRWTILGEQHVVAAQPGVAAFWHECLPLLPGLWMHLLGRGVTGTPHVLVSKHRDGRFIGTAVRRFGVVVVHGSTAKGRGAADAKSRGAADAKSRGAAGGTSRGAAGKGGSASVRTLLGVLSAGDYVLITPDGPRGPRRRALPGVAQLAGFSGAPVIPIGAQTSRRHILPTWDRMRVPLPWGRGVIVCGEPIAVPRDGWADAIPAIEAALDAALAQADALCRA